MSFKSNEESIESFFDKRETTSRIECDEIARNIVGNGCVAQAAGTQGPSSYTVECTTKSILSFRQRGNILDSRVINLAKDIYGRLVPDVSYCRNVGEGAEGLIVYRMSYLPGTPLQQLYPQVAEAKPEDRLKVLTFYKHLAGYVYETPHPANLPQANTSQVLRQELVEAFVRGSELERHVAYEGRCLQN